MNRSHLAVLSLLLFVPLACQKDKSVDTSGVDPIAREILDAIARNTPDGVYETYFTPEYKSDVSLEEWREITRGYQLMLGNVVSVTRLRGRAQWVADQFVEGEVVYQVQWDKGKGQMELDVTEEDGWKVRQVKIESPLIDQRLTTLPTTFPTTQPATP